MSIYILYTDKTEDVERNTTEPSYDEDLVVKEKNLVNKTRINNNLLRGTSPRNCPILGSKAAL